MKNLYLIVGESGTGKDTIVNALCDKYGYKRLVSYTTRPRRLDSKTDEKSHIFVDTSAYETDKERDIIAAETVYDGHYYWATKQQIETSDLYIVDLQGIDSIRERCIGRPIVVIGIVSDRNTRIERMSKRGNSRSEIDKRLSFDDRAFKDLSLYMDNCVYNGRNASNQQKQIDDLVEEVQAIILQHEKENRHIPDRESVLNDISKAVAGYQETDMVPISGRLLYDIAAILWQDKQDTQTETQTQTEK